MGYQLFDTGEEWLWDYLFLQEQGVTSLEVTLYNDSTDLLADADTDPSTDVTTEPGGASYARATVNLGDAGFVVQDDGGDWEVVFPDVQFDISDSSQNVDSWLVVIPAWASDDGGATQDWNFANGPLEDSQGAAKTVDLSVATSPLTLSGVNINIS